MNITGTPGIKKKDMLALSAPIASSKSMCSKYVFGMLFIISVLSINLNTD